MNESLAVNRENRIQRLTLQREEKRNALDLALCRDLLAALQEADRDDHVGAILLEARGPVFCAGMDLREAHDPATARKLDVHEELFTIGTRLRKPLIAAVQGDTYGGGVGLVANAHIVLASERAMFGLTEIRVAMWPFVIWRAVTAALGRRRTLELALTARCFSATDALQWGLVHYAVPGSHVHEQASAVAAKVASFSPDAVHRGILFDRESSTLPPEQVGRWALRERVDVFGSPDFAEGVRAFAEKRPAVWPSLASTPGRDLNED